MARDAQYMKILATAVGATQSKEGVKAFNALSKKLLEESK